MMQFLRWSRICKSILLRHTAFLNKKIFMSGWLSCWTYTCLNYMEIPRRRSIFFTEYSTVGAIDEGIKRGSGKATLALDLASLVEESADINGEKPKSRTEMKRYLESRIKKRVKGHYDKGKFHELMMKVIATPDTLQDAYGCLRLNSNVDASSSNTDDGGLSFESMAFELSNKGFIVNLHTFSVSTKGAANKETLILPKLKLKIVQEAIRIVLEVIYKPHFSKISHGGRSGRGHFSALKYIRKGISVPDWWFSLIISKKLDDCVFSQLVSLMKEKIEDAYLCDMIQDMYESKVLNMEFGGFPKGHGLPQEGILCPILINIYLSALDHEIFRLSMKYELLKSSSHSDEQQFHSKLRHWFRKQMKGKDMKDKGNGKKNSNSVIISCRFMDELFFAVSELEDSATISFKSELISFLQNTLHLEVDTQTKILRCSGHGGVRFLGNLIRNRPKTEHPPFRVLHKLKEKVKLFASQKQLAWDTGATRIGKKWLAHGLKKVKESEIKHLADGGSLLSQVSCFRKPGMKTDHWYKHLLRAWMQTIDAKAAENEKFILSKYIAEPAIPRELRDSFYEFQKCAENYIISETAKTLSLLPNSNASIKPMLEIIAPVVSISKRLVRYGLATSKGHSHGVSFLILLDDVHILDWFVGIVLRWLKWYRDCDNFSDVKFIIANQVRKSCIRTLASKYCIPESETEKKFDLELSRIPCTEDVEQEMMKETLHDLAFDKEEEALMYGISFSGLCLLSVSRLISTDSRHFNCFVVGCSEAAPCVYTLHVMERQKFPAWKTGFATCIHPSLNKRKFGCCNKHLTDLFLGNISLQCIDFASWK